MTKHPWKGSLKSMSNHIDPEKEEQLKWVKIGKQPESSLQSSCHHWRIWDSALKPKRMQFKSSSILPAQFYPERGYLWYTEWQLIRKIENQVKKIIKLTKSINHGNKERNLRNKAEAIHLIEDFQKQYESLYSLYEDLREESSATSKDSDSDNNNQEPENTSDLEDTILKDKLTSSSEVKKIINLDSHSESGDIILKDLESESIISQRLTQIKDLEGQVANLKLEISTLCSEKRQLEEQVECKSDEALQMKERITRLEARILETEAKSEENEVGFNSLRKQSSENEQKYLSRISELVAQGNDMQIELNALKQQKGELEGRFLHDTEKWSSQVDGLMEQVNSLKHELVTVNSHKSELEMELKKKSKETLQIKDLKNEMTLKEQSLAEENKSLKSQEVYFLPKYHDYEDEILSRRDQESKEQTGKFRKREKLFSGGNGSLTKRQKRLQLELEKEKDESSLSKSQVEKISRDLEKLSKSNFQIVERKVEEMAEEFRKQLEDKYRILSRRIRVAEQLQVENKEWYRKTKESYEQEKKDLKCRADRNEIEFKNIKDMTLTANDVLTSLDGVALKFEECSANFLNRISKASCELKFAKHWAMRKNKAVFHAKDDLDCLLAQLDDKEAEILVFREKVWKSENKVRELEKMVKEKEDAMLGLNEEKREAIRQLCVWIDYHRGRSDYYKKLLSEMNAGRKRAS
ncbi:hypothetical protein DH2020_028911 [Rehmannia glutinosa]|uniref:NAB domain-containing protein n=1 Tax=Rehmannia glutinosa TaxID=99300 RepID=A0ABR0VT20_REHGL